MGASAKFKTVPEDFRVTEELDLAFSGAGEHAYFLVEKRAWNTRDIALQIAQAYQIAELDVGYAGLKDKQAVTRQWFSVRTTADKWLLNLPGVSCLAEHRHSRKLRRGQHACNHFEIVLRDVCGAAPDDFATLADGFANTFGPQRVSASNVTQATEWILQRRQRRLSKRRQGWHLSVLRSELFNNVVASRCQLAQQQACAGPGMLLEGDVVVDGQPTGPLWGRGRSTTQAHALQLEQQALAPFAEICNALEFSGVEQARRKLFEAPLNLRVEALAEHQLLLNFALPPGVYATTMLSTRVLLEEP